MSKKTTSWQSPPDRPGLYYISLSDAPLRQTCYAYSAGVTDVRPLRSILTRILSVSTCRSYQGILREEEKTIPPGQALQLFANDQMFDIAWIETFGEDEVYFLAETVSHWISMLPPVYIGIAKDQTIAERLAQHQAGFLRPEASASSTFASRAKKQGLAWHDLQASWIEATSRKHLAQLNDLESYLHATIRPILSNR